MFDFGWGELLIIGVVALIVVGPKDLPGMFRALGRMTGKMRSMAREFHRAMDKAAADSGVTDIASDLRTATSKRSLGLDAVDKVASVAGGGWKAKSGKVISAAERVSAEIGKMSDEKGSSSAEQADSDSAQDGVTSKPEESIDSTTDREKEVPVTPDQPRSSPASTTEDRVRASKEGTGAAQESVIDSSKSSE